MVTLSINGRQQNVDLEPDTPLLWALRDGLGMTGTKYGCGQALCGACTIWLDGVATRSCGVTIADAAGKPIVTIEGLSGKVADAVQTAWTSLDVPQCGYCHSGQVMAATALLTETKKPSDADIDSALSGNICRCATYHRIRNAVHEAARILGA